MSTLDSVGAAETLRWLASLLVVRATGALLLAAVAMLVLRRASAATRHAALGLTVAVLLGLPLLSGLLPRWELGLLPARQLQVPRASQPVPAIRWDAPARPSIVERAPVPLAPAAKPGVEPAAAARVTARAARTGLWSQWGALSLSAWLLTLWMAGICTGLAQFLMAVYLVRRTARGATAVADPEWLDALAQASAHLGLSRRVRLLSSPAVGVPVVFGYWHAVVLLPDNASDWPEDRRRAFLLHELAHVARHDCLTQTLAHVGRLVYWPNPLAWWLVRRLRAEAERACDDRVLVAGTPASDYAEHLLDAARDLSRARRPLAVLAVVERSRLEDRLLALLDPGLRRGALTGRSLAFGALLSLVVACSVAALQPVARVVTRVATFAAPVGAARKADAVERGATASAARATVAVESPVKTTMGAAPPPVEDRPDTPLAGASASAEEASTATSEAEPQIVAVPAHAAALHATSGLASEPTDGAPASATSAAVERSIPVIRISTEMIQIDAVVTDKSGHPIVDLKPEDFEVFENGRPQRISHLVYVKTGQGPTTGGPAALAAAPETSVPRTLLFVVDDTSMSLQSVLGVRQGLMKLVNTLGPTDRAGIVSTRKRGPLYLSTDRAVLAKSAAELRYALWNRSGQPFLRNRDDLSLESQLALDSMQMLKDSVEALRGMPGRKAVIFFSEGFPTLASDDQTGRMQDLTYRIVDTLYDDVGLRAAMHSLIDLANRSSVVIYTIDAAGLRLGGLRPGGIGASGESSLMGPTIYEGPINQGSQILTASQLSRGVVAQVHDPIAAGMRAETLDRQGHQDSLIELAEDTGGIAVDSQNDIGTAIGRVLADHAGYYLIGYEPAASTFAQTEGAVSFHEVKVKVKREGLRVRSRKGFYGVSDEQIAKAAPPLPPTMTK